METKTTQVFICFAFFSICLIIEPFITKVCSQESDKAEILDSQDYFLFYNVENLFDLKEDSLTDDDSFTPAGEKNWNHYRLNKKINSIYKVIIGAGEWEPPALVGLAEVESRVVLEKLLHYTPLYELNYRIIHYDSKDERGIDVALLYRQNKFKPLLSKTKTIVFPFDRNNKTRDILFVKGVFGFDTLYIFVNHWPSRYGGGMSSEPYRMHAAHTLSAWIDSLNILKTDGSIIICGDFNDEAEDASLENFIDYFQGKIQKLRPNSSKNIEGSLKFKEKWYIFDLFFVSEDLLKEESCLRTNTYYDILNMDYLLVPDQKGLGYKPYRTYTGPRYQGGYSDHLPVRLRLIRK